MKEFIKKILTKKSEGVLVEISAIVTSFGGMSCSLYTANTLAVNGKTFLSCMAVFVAMLCLMHPIAKMDALARMTPEQKAIDDAEEAAGYDLDFWED